MTVKWDQLEALPEACVPLESVSPIKASSGRLVINPENFNFLNLPHNQIICDEVIFERCQEDQFAQIDDSFTYLRHVKSVILKKCLLDKPTIQSFLHLAKRHLNHIKSISLISCKWRYSPELQSILNIQFAHVPDGDFSANQGKFIRETFSWYHEGTDNFTPFTVFQLENFACAQTLLRNLFKAVPELSQFNLNGMDLSHLYRPLPDLNCTSPHSFVSTLFSLSGSLKSIDLSGANLYDSFFRCSRSLWGDGGLKGLERLNLANNCLSDMGLIFLLTLDEDFQRVGDSKSLQVIDLSRNQIQLASPQTLHVLMQCLSLNETLKIVLTGNPLIREDSMSHPRIEFFDDFVQDTAASVSSEEQIQSSWVDLLNQSDDDSEFVASDSAVANSDSSSDDISLASEGSDIFKMLDD